MQPDHNSRGARTSKFENCHFLIEINCTKTSSCASKPLSCKAARHYINRYTKFVKDSKGVRSGARTSNFEKCYFPCLPCISIYTCLLVQQTSTAAMQLVHILIHIPSLNRNDRGLVGERGSQTSKIATFLKQSIVYRCTCIFLCCPQNQLLCQQAAVVAMHLHHITIHKPSLVRTESGLGWAPGPRTSNC